MRIGVRSFRVIVPAAALLLLTCVTPTQAIVLVADRLSNSIYKYSDSGDLLGSVVTDAANLVQTGGITLSPDFTKLYVSSTSLNQVTQYDYNAATATASNPSVFADAADGLMFPNGLLFSQDGGKIYVSNLGGSGVAQFNADGTPAGLPINGFIDGGPVDDGMGGMTGSMIFQFSGLAHAPTGELLVGGFQNFPGGNRGAVAKSDAAVATLSTFIGPSESLNGASGLLAVGNDLYVSSLFAGSIQRFNATTGAVDPSFGITALGFPQALVAAPSGGGFLAGVLGLSDGAGQIAHYDFNGNLVGDGVFANNGGGGFTEATAFVVAPTVPEPTTVSLACGAVAMVVFAARRRRAL